MCALTICQWLLNVLAAGCGVYIALKSRQNAHTCTLMKLDDVLIRVVDGLIISSVKLCDGLVKELRVSANVEGIMWVAEKKA